MRARGKEVEAEKVSIQFGPEVRRELARLEEALRGKEGFDSDAYGLLETLNSGKPMDLRNAFTNIAMVVNAASEYEIKNGDHKVGMALTNFIGHLMGQSRDAKPFSVFVASRAMGR